MNRRNLLKSLGLGAISTVAFPAWANGWTTSSIPETPIADTDEMLSQLIDIIIPKTDTPGALELGVDKFVKAMIQTMHTEEDQKAFYEHLNMTNVHIKKLKGYDLNTLSENGQKEALIGLSESEDAEWKGFFQTLKRYTVQGYTGSEWYMTTINGYEMAPGYGHGCVDI